MLEAILTNLESNPMAFGIVKNTKQLAITVASCWTVVIMTTIIKIFHLELDCH
jgi:hypothetical protein